MKPFVNERYDKSTNMYIRRFRVSTCFPCYLSFFYTAQRELESISFDAAYADDYHYEIKVDQIPKLLYAQSNAYSEIDIVTLFTKQLCACSNPIEISSWLRDIGVEFQIFHFD